MKRSVRSSLLKSRVKAAPQIIVNLPLLPSSNSQQFDRCATGEFNGHFREIGAGLLASGAGHAIVRLGKEANRNSPPWGYGSASQRDGYVGCFRNASESLRETAPNLKIEWTNGRQTLSNVNPLDFYPGDDWVHIIGVHYYNNPKLGRMSTQAIWDRNYNQRYPNGVPLGLGAWFEEIRKLGKPMSVSEWGLWGETATARQADNPVYIENMYRFFRDNEEHIAYESYFDCQLRHELHPSTRFPRAREAYRKLWSAGQ